MTWFILLLLTWATTSAVSIALCGRGFLHPESYSFLPHYLSGRSMLELIYDNRVTDWGNYQAREFSFVFDWLDCQFISWCVRHGHPHFFSVSHYFLLLCAGVTAWHFSTKHLQLSPITAYGISLLIWTNPTAVFYSSFYRSAKVSLFCAALLAISAWLAAARNDQGRWRAILFGMAMAALPMFDKQGFLFVGCAIPFLMWNYWLERSPRSRQLLAAGLMAALFAWSYQRFIGPAFTHHLLGYAVNRGYTSIPVHDLLTKPGFVARVIFGGAIFTFDSLRVPLGNLPLGLALIAVVWVWRQAPSEPVRGRTWWLSPRGMLIILAASIFALFSAMLMLFPAMFSIEHRRLFYPLPVFALWIFAVATAAREWVRRHPAREFWMEIVVGALVLSNVAALQDHRFIFRHGKYEPYVANAEKVTEALRPENLRWVDPATARSFFSQAPYFEDAVPSDLDHDRIYLLFASRRAEDRQGEAKRLPSSPGN